MTHGNSTSFYKSIVTDKYKKIKIKETDMGNYKFHHKITFGYLQWIKVFKNYYNPIYTKGVQT